MENRVKYNLVDTFGNPLELQKENGIQISYIWGYHQTKPIAKLENCSYSTINSSLITAAQTASNNNNEYDLITALNSIRNSLPNAMVTTITYKPLIGVSTITDPKGQTTTYEYDSFGRLKAVKDDEGNILSENQYHYRTQN